MGMKWYGALLLSLVCSALGAVTPYLYEHTFDLGRVRWIGRFRTEVGEDGVPEGVVTIPAGIKQIHGFQLAPELPELSACHTVSFEYRISSPDAWLGFKATDAPFVQGYDACWPLGRLPKDADRVWHTFIADLRRPTHVWGDRPSPTARHLDWRVVSPAGRDTTLRIRNVVLRRQSLRLAPGRDERAPDGAVDTTVCRWEDGRRLRVTFTVTNELERPFTGRLALVEAESLAAEETGALVKVPAGGQARLSLTLTLRGEPAPLTPLTVRVRLEDAAGTLAGEASARAVTPLPEPGAPCLLFHASGLEASRRALRTEEGARWWASFVKKADWSLAQPVDLPPRGGQWWHYYSCASCGAALTTKSRTEHVCKACGKVFTGWPYDDVAFFFEHNQLAANVYRLGLAYALSGEGRYAKGAAAILLAYAGRYLDYPLHDTKGKPLSGGGHVLPQVLDEAVWLIKMLCGYDCVRAALGQEERSRIEEGLLRPAAAYIKSVNHGIHNHECWHLAAYGMAGIVLGLPEFVYDALHGRTGLLQQLRQGTMPEGPWYEGAWGYHFYTLRSLRPFALALANLGLDVASPLYRSMYVAPFLAATPDWRLPAFHDTARLEMTPAKTAGDYEAALALWPEDPLFSWWLSQTSRGNEDAILTGLRPLAANPEAPRLASLVWPQAGWAILRSQTPLRPQDGPMPSNYLALDFGPHGGWHGHYDKLSLVLWGHGRMLAEDPGCIAYGNPCHHEWYKATISHNTVMVDGESQREATGSLLAFAADSNASIASFDAGPVYAGVRLQRHLALVDDLVLDLVSVRCDRSRDITWLFHARDRRDAAMSGTPLPEPPPLAGAKWARDWRTTPHDGHWGASWAPDGVTLTLAQTSPAGEVWSAIGRAQPPPEEFVCRFNHVRGQRQALFASVFALSPEGSSPVACRVLDSHLAEDGSCSLTAEVGRRRLVLLVSPDGVCRQGTFVAEGRMALAEQDGDGTLRRVLVAP